MSHCLHITIHERSEALPRRAATGHPGRTSSDPESNNVMPDPDDPESNNVMPDPDDPESSYVLLDRHDPSYPFATGCSCGGAEPSTGSRKTAAPNSFIAPREYSGFVIVRMAEGVVGPAQNLWTLAEIQTPKLTGLQAVLELLLKSPETPTAPGPQPAASHPPEEDEEGLPQPPAGVLDSRPLVELQLLGPRGNPIPRSQYLGTIRGLESTAATTAFPPLHSLTAYWRLDLRTHPERTEEVVAQLNRLPEVDLAYRELAAVDAQLDAPIVETFGHVFAEDQGYLDDAPLGIGASWAWKSLTRQPWLEICDLEQGWNPNHADFDPQLVKPDPLYGANRALDERSPGHHGTAVLGQLAATGKIKGTASGVGQIVLASHYKSRTEDHPFAGTNGHVAAAVVQALVQALAKGDILLLEVQRGRLPAEIDEADCDAIRLASARGVIVVEAAGNGGFDLDGYTAPDTGRSFRRGDSRFVDSGAILVGAARAGLPHDRAPFSNYGSRLDTFAWGEAVTTCGYGDLAGTYGPDFYTNTFSGTSSASPIIAGAAALLQALHKEHAGFALEPRAMRSLLADPATGTRQGPNVPGFIGVMPDLAAIVRGRLQLVPDVYMRRSVGDDGTTPGPQEEISSSPDILVWKGEDDPVERFGEGPRANTPAPGSPIDPGNPNAIYSDNNLYVRLRNRGMGEEKARVRLFASPAATLITPERWMPIAEVDVQEIVQGDILTVSPPVSVCHLPQKWPQDASGWLKQIAPGAPAGIVPPYSFLAVQLPWKEKSSSTPDCEWTTTVLPPGPPYFDWDQFRSFLRGRGVAWRNVHPIKAHGDMTLAFLFAGTPDRTRHFDFEVIQRLPAEAEVTLSAGDALAAKLRQRQPWLLDQPSEVVRANGSGDLRLPRRPRTTLRQVALAPGVYAHAAFQVKTGTKPLLRGHSLAIRQLWHGEEVGRITWCFGLEPIVTETKPPKGSGG